MDVLKITLHLFRSQRGLATGLFAGVFADRAGPPLPTSTKPQPGPGQPRAALSFYTVIDCR